MMMKIDNLFNDYLKIVKLFNDRKKQYEQIIDKEGKSDEELDKLSRFEFTPDQEKIIAETNFAIMELNKLKNMAVFAEYLGLLGEQLKDFEGEDGFNQSLSYLRSPILVVGEDGEFKVNNEEDWLKYRIFQVENLKQHLEFVKKQENGDI